MVFADFEPSASWNQRYAVDSQKNSEALLHYLMHASILAWVQKSGSLKLSFATAGAGKPWPADRSLRSRHRLRDEIKE
jgi:hypothetical protein